MGEEFIPDALNLVFRQSPEHYQEFAGVGSGV